MKLMRSSRNRILAGWLLTFVMLIMATASGASWQCLDGHACPPGCLMTKGSPAPAKRACCPTASVSCPLSPSAVHIAPVGTGEHCSSSVCVLRLRARPDAAKHSVGLHIADLWFVLPVSISLPHCSVVSPAFFPDPVYPARGGGTSPASPRAPPSLLG